MKLVSYNIQYGYGADGRYDLPRTARVLDGADVIAPPFDAAPFALSDLLPPRESETPAT